MSVGVKADSLHQHTSHRTRGATGLLATATGLCVANLYYGQPLLDAIARGLHTSSSTAALLITLTQVGYAVGLLLLLPLGDLVDRAKFVPLMSLTTAVALAVMALAPSAPLFHEPSSARPVGRRGVRGRAAAGRGLRGTGGRRGPPGRTRSRASFRSVSRCTAFH